MKRGTTTSPDPLPPLVQNVSFAGSGRNQLLVVTLRDRRVLGVPLALFPTLQRAKAADRAHWRLIASGRGISWPDLDIDLSTDGLFAARPEITRHARANAGADWIAAVLRSAAKGKKPLPVADLASVIARVYKGASFDRLVQKLEAAGKVERGRPSARRAS